MKNTGLAHSTWCVGLKMAWGGRLDRFDCPGGPDGDRAVRMYRRLRAVKKGRECHHWILRGFGRREAVAGTNYIGAARARSICVRAAK